MSIPPPRPAFDPAAARLARELKHTRPLIGCRFDPSGRFLFASAEDDTVQRFDLASGAKVAFVGHTSWVRGMAFFGAKGAPLMLVSADYHGKLGWWEAAADTPKLMKTVDAHVGFARSVAVSPDQTTVASCGNDHLVKLWTAAGAAVRTLEGHESHVYNVAFSPDGTRLVSCDLKGVVKDWNLKTGTCDRDIDAKALAKYDPTFMADIGGARGMAFKPDGAAVAVCGITNVSNAFAGVGNPAVVLVDWAEGKGRLLKLKDAFQGTAWGVCFHPLGGVIAAGGGGQGRIWFWKADDTSVHTLNVPTNCRDLAVSPDGSRFAVAGANGTAYVYDFSGRAAPTPIPAKK